MASRLLGPQQILSRHPADTSAYRERVIAKARRVGMPVQVDGRTLTAYVNEGRWVADCPHCFAGISIHPEWDFAACLECCRTYRSVTLPVTWPDIEAVLDVRPVRYQHWQTRESVEDLERENVEAGLPRRRVGVAREAVR